MCESRSPPGGLGGQFLSCLVLSRVFRWNSIGTVFISGPRFRWNSGGGSPGFPIPIALAPSLEAHHFVVGFQRHLAQEGVIKPAVVT